MTLNTVLLLEVADHIEREPERFNLGIWTNAEDADDLKYGCHTTACVAGWVNALTGAQTSDELRDGERAARRLGLSYDAANRLFYWSNSVWCDLADDLGLEVRNPHDPIARSIDTNALTGQLAAKGLRMIAAGEVTL